MGYVDQRDDCQGLSEQRIDDFLDAKEQSADPRSRNTVLLAIFSKCMQGGGWGVSSPKMDAVVEKYGEKRFASLLPKKSKKDDDKKDGKVAADNAHKEEKRVPPSRESGLETSPQDKRFQSYQGRGGTDLTRQPSAPYWQEPASYSPQPAPIAPDSVRYQPSALGVGPSPQSGMYQPITR